MRFNSAIRLAVAAIVFAAATGGAALAQGRGGARAVYSAPSADTLATIRQRGEVRIGVAPAEPMVMHEKSGRLAGYSIELGERLARDLGVQGKFVETSWPRLIEGMQNGDYDLVASGLWVTSARALAVNFSTPTASEGIYLIAGKDVRGKSRSVFDRAGVTIAVYADTPQVELAKRLFPSARLMMLNGTENQLTPVIEGKAQAALVPTLNPAMLVARSGGRLNQPFPEPLARTHTAFAIRKGDADFLNYLNTWLLLQKESGWLDDRLHHWNNRLAQ